MGDTIIKLGISLSKWHKGVNNWGRNKRVIKRRKQTSVRANWEKVISNKWKKKDKRDDQRREGFCGAAGGLKV